MTSEEFATALRYTCLRARAADAARAVLVDGRRQADVHRLTGLRRSAVTRAVNTVLRARPDAWLYPETWQTVTVTVPPGVADQIRRAARAALRVLRGH